MSKYIDTQPHQIHLTRHNLNNIVAEVDDTIEACHRAIRQYQDAIRSLQGTRNMYCKVSHLPDELLEEIFCSYVEDEDDCASCIPLTHVCRRWRQVAIGSPKLWTRLVSSQESNPEPLREFLTRSVPLSIDARISIDEGFKDREESASTSLMLSNLSRIRHLRLRASFHSPTPNPIVNNTPTTASRLQSLMLDLRRTHNSDECVVSLFSAGLPVLRRVTIQCACIYYPLTLAQPSITTFILSSHDWTQQPVAAFHLLAALCKMPSLTCLSLSLCLPRSIPDDITNQIVTLSRLRELHVHDTLDGMAWLLNHLRLPSDVSLNLQGPNTGYSNPRPLSTFGRAVALTLRSLDEDNEAFSVVHQSRGDDGTLWFDFHLWGHFSRDDAGQPSPSQILHLKLGSDFVEFSQMGNIWKELPLQHVRTLKIGQIYPDHRFFSAFVLAYRYLRNLYSFDVAVIERWNPSWFKYIFPSNAVEHLHPFFKLRTVVLDGIAFGCFDKDSGHDVQEKAAQPLRGADVIQQTLRDWQARRGRLEGIQLKDCHGLTEEEIAVLDFGCPHKVV